MRFAFRRHFKRRSRVIVLGLDCAGPQLVFDEFKEELPTLSRIAATGTWGELESSIPCITVPAWASMLSSHDPGVLGVYGFRNRADTGYTNMVTADSASITVPRLWDFAGSAGLESILVGVPQTYPPQPLNGYLVGDFMTPGIHTAFTYPAVLKHEVLKVCPHYAFDVREFRTDDKATLLQRLFDLSEIQYALVRHLMTTRPWDLFMHVNIGVDRVHHGFWRFHDPAHRLHQPGHPYAGVIREYYKMVDYEIGRLLELAGDDVYVLVVSDHGVKRMDGGICLNEWLWRNGWLALKSPPPEGRIIRFEDAEVDWSATKAWGAGGYYGRVFLNVAGREPQGVIPKPLYEQTRAELAHSLADIPGPNGEPLNTRVIRPEAVYAQVNRLAPDLMVYFGDLHWRAVGSLGHGRHYTLENDTGPDDANHDTHGMFILYEPNHPGSGHINGHQLMDIAPTLLNRMGLDAAPALQGRPIAPR